MHRLLLFHYAFLMQIDCKYFNCSKIKIIWRNIQIHLQQLASALVSRTFLKIIISKIKSPTMSCSVCAYTNFMSIRSGPGSTNEQLRTFSLIFSSFFRCKYSRRIFIYIRGTCPMHINLSAERYSAEIMVEQVSLTVGCEFKSLARKYAGQNRRRKTFIEINLENEQTLVEVVLQCKTLWLFYSATNDVCLHTRRCCMEVCLSYNNNRWMCKQIRARALTSHEQMGEHTLRITHVRKYYFFIFHS